MASAFVKYPLHVDSRQVCFGSAALRCHFFRPKCQQSGRDFSSFPRLHYPNPQHHDGRFGSRLRTALRNTKVEWYSIPVGLGIGFLGFTQIYKRHRKENENRTSSQRHGDDNPQDRPEDRAQIRPTGPWQIQVMSLLPLKAISRLWGRFNELRIPYYLRVPGFRLYAWIFGVNLSEVSESDLHAYPNLASFFYRTLKPGSRPLDPNHSALLSPADGRVLQYGIIESGEVEQVKGMTYSLDALLGIAEPSARQSLQPRSPSFSSPAQSGVRKLEADEELVKQEEEFAQVNGISYTLPTLFSGHHQNTQKLHAPSTDVSTTPKPSSESEVRTDLALGNSSVPWYASLTAKNKSALYYVVIYLAPGDYHRFHSPTSWVVERRRHFAGELYSVSPYLQRSLPGLFTLNERVVLLGRWRWGFFSFIPVGATNVGSIKINFDSELRTNSLTTDTAADRAAEEASRRGEQYSGYAEATYEGASNLLRGYALKRGEEMGGFQLGSTVVLVFEAPRANLAASKTDSNIRPGWRWALEKGQKVRMGEALGWVDEG
ncbi:MAG: phosphatidylserine decarboxylase 1 [Trizodia sp. TS-e1964]|nr:MAG: phosphatidylserine decarboxylase 1 [Trizodia sp. TS-e1964]